MRHKERFNALDIAKGIAMLAVVLGHSISESWVGNYLYSFHLPLFFFISGYVYKELSCLQVWKKRTRQLLIPYFITSIFIVLILLLKSIIFDNRSNLNETFLNGLFSMLYANGMNVDKPFYIELIGPIWFLPAMTLASVLLSICINKKNGWFILIVMILLGVWSSRYLWLPWSIQAVPVCTLFMWMGRICRIKKQLNTFLIASRKNFKLLGVALLWILSASFGGRCKIANNTYPNPLFNLLAAYTGCFVFIWISDFIEKRTKKVSQLLIKIGQSTIPILCVHTLDLRLITWKNVFGIFNITGGIRYSILLICAHVMIAFLVVVILELKEKIKCY